jgi:hypothetical protein
VARGDLGDALEPVARQHGAHHLEVGAAWGREGLGCIHAGSLGRHAA